MKNLTLFVVLGLLFSTGAVFAIPQDSSKAASKKEEANVKAASKKEEVNVEVKADDKTAEVAPKKDGVCKRVKDCITNAAGKTKNHVSGHKLAYGLGSAAVVAAVAGVWYLLHDKQEEEQTDEATA